MPTAPPKRVYKFKIASGLDTNQLIRFAHRVSNRLGGKDKYFVCRGDWTDPLPLDASRMTADECAHKLQYSGCEAESLNFPPFADPTLDVGFAMGEIFASAERLELVREVIEAYVAAGGGDKDAYFFGQLDIPAEFHAYQLFFKTIHFVLKQAEATGTKLASLRVATLAGAPQVTLEGDLEPCPPCRIEHRKGLCDDVRDLGRPELLGFRESFADGSMAAVSLLSRSVYHEARTLERFDGLIAEWQKLLAEPWVW